MRVKLEALGETKSFYEAELKKKKPDRKTEGFIFIGFKNY